MSNGAVIDAVLSNALKGFKRRDTDYDKDGILYCGKCGQPRQAWIDWLPDDEGVVKKRLVPVVCQCDVDEDRAEQEKAERDAFYTSLRRLRSVIDAAEAKWTFDKDDDAEGKISVALRKYAENFDDMKRDNMGILLYGSKGTGKSFYASCLVNAIEQQRRSSAMVTTASLMATLQASWDKQEIIEALCKFQLLALDDLGVERDTSYGAEMMYSVIDARYRSGKPTIVTTNLGLQDLQTETDLLRSRLYDRVIEMCPITILMTGESRRRKIADERKQKAREFFKRS